ncbi:MAG: aminotransferase class I/II-fold pyridoxal phosphate-dependent enzyme [Thermoplasmata archaeon]
MVARRVGEVEISGIRRMFEAARPDSINLGLGEPDFDPPAVVLQAFAAAIQNGGNHYGPTAGLAALRDRVAELYRDRRPTTGRDNVLITSGGTEALMATALALYDPGDEVLVPDPGFVLYAPHARLAGARPVPYPLVEADGFVPRLGEIEARITSRTTAIVVNSPSNPTGGVFPRKTIEGIVSLAERHGLTIVSDEVYDRITYETPATSFWGLTDRTVVVNSFSKTFAATGWRLGFVVAPAPLAAAIGKIHYHIMACPATPAQTAVLAGLTADLADTRRMVREFRARRDLLLREMRSIPGVHCVRPRGAFYLFPRFDWNETSTEAAMGLLEAGLIATPGDAFGSLGAKHLRLSFAASRDALRRGMAILRRYAEERAGGAARPGSGSRAGPPARTSR